MIPWFGKKRKPTDLVTPAPPPPAARGGDRNGAPPPGEDAAKSGHTDAGAPSADPANRAYPRLGTSVRVAFANGQRKWEERADLIQLLGRTLGQAGHPMAPHDDGLVHRASGIVLAPNLCGFQPRDRGGVSTATTVEARHPRFGDAGVFEFQHSFGDDLQKSIASGFESWLRGDLPVLLDALREKPAECMAMEMQFPAAADAPGGGPGRTRRCLFGPVAHYRQNPPASPPESPVIPEGEYPGEGGATEGRQDHPFCPCCLFTHTFEAFQSLIESDGFYAFRFYAARGADGKAEADCRVNGRDWPAGKVALIPYAATWPPAGMEFRKQYVILQTATPRPASGDGA